MAPTLIRDIKALSSQLDNDKITIRKVCKPISLLFLTAWIISHVIFFPKKNEDGTISLLNNSTLIGLLDKESEDPNANHDPERFTWTDLWKAAIRYTKIEAEKWIKDKEKLNNKPAQQQSSTSVANLANKAKQITNLINVVLKKCSKSLSIYISSFQITICLFFSAKQMIKTDYLLDSLFDFLSTLPGSIRLRQFFGSAIVRLIMRRVLPYEKYLREFRAREDQLTNQWRQLLKVAFELFETVPDGKPENTKYGEDLQLFSISRSQPPRLLRIPEQGRRPQRRIQQHLEGLEIKVALLSRAVAK